MKVLLLGATGNIGSRLIPALLAHHHSVVAYVRSPSKLQSLLPATLHEQILVVQGDATDSAAIKRAILEHRCEAVVSAAGVAALAPWSHGDLPVIFKAVVEGVRAAGAEGGKMLRLWVMGGQGVLKYPGTGVALSKYFPIFLEHNANLALLTSLPPNTIAWSMLCPNWMVAESRDLSLTSATLREPLDAEADVPPRWNDSGLKHVPLVGKTLVAAMNARRYRITLEQGAEFVAGDLENGRGEWEGKAVGVIGKGVK